MKDIVDMDVFKDYEIKTTICGHYGSDENKSIKVITNPFMNTIKYLVENKKNKKADYFLKLKKAIEFYNSI